MADEQTTIGSLRQAVAQFVREREWDRYHSPKNLAMALGVEAAELMEHFLWIENEESRQAVQEQGLREQVADEIVDVACLVLALCNAIGLDLSDELERKMSKNVLKYPVDKVRGHYRVRE